MTIPKLKLISALLDVKVTIFVLQLLQIKFYIIYLITDSKYILL